MNKLKVALLSAKTVDHPVSQGVTAAILTALMGQVQLLVVPIAILAVLMCVDFATGIRAAKCRGEKISSQKYSNGVGKKVYLLALVLIGLAIDTLLLYTAALLDYTLAMRITFATFISLWLAINEMISILENIQDMGVDMPKWLVPFVKGLKSKVDDNAPTLDAGKEEDNHAED